MLRWAQVVTVLCGILGTAVALGIAKLNLVSLWDLFLQLIGLTGGALAGLFALGIFTRRAHGPGALIGAAASVLTLYYAQRYTKLSFFLYGALGILTCVLVGYLASLILPGTRKPLEGLTLFTRRPRGHTHSTEPVALAPTTV
jgi:Na+/proline symporter